MTFSNKSSDNKYYIIMIMIIQNQMKYKIVLEIDKTILTHNRQHECVE